MDNEGTGVPAVEVRAANCSDTVREFDAQGWHRTASEVDRLSGEWIHARLGGLGIDAEVLPFPFSRIDAGDASVTAGRATIPAVHLPDSGLRPPGSVIAGVFGPGSINLLRTGAHGMPAEWGAADADTYRAVVVAIDGAPGGVSLLNAWQYDEPGDTPILQVPGEAFEMLARARDLGTPVEVRCGGTRTQTTAVNVRARVAGSEPNLPPIVVLTPRSGWWHCAGERGGGLAVWLEVARVARTLGLRRDLVLLATTGHELGFLGVRRYFDADPALAMGATAWVHLGANIGAADSRLMVRGSDPAMLALARACPAFATTDPAPQFVVAERPVGEAREIAARGGRFVSLVGAGFPLFHSTLDRWPAAIDAVAIARAAEGVIEVVQAFAGMDD